MATLHSSCNNFNIHDGQGSRSFVARIKAAIDDGQNGLSLTKRKLENLHSEAGTREDLISCFGTLAAGDHVLDTVKKLHLVYENCLEGYIICCGKDWIKQIKWRQYDFLSGQYIQAKAYADVEDRQQIDASGGVSQEFRIEEILVNTHLDREAEAWITARPPRIVLFRLLLRKPATSIREQIVLPGACIDSTRGLCETLMHEVLHLLGFNHVVLPDIDMSERDRAENRRFNAARECCWSFEVGYLARSKKAHLAPLNVESIVYFILLTRMRELNRAFDSRTWTAKLSETTAPIFPRNNVVEDSRLNHIQFFRDLVHADSFSFDYLANSVRHEHPGLLRFVRDSEQRSRAKGDDLRWFLTLSGPEAVQAEATLWRLQQHLQGSLGNFEWLCRPLRAVEYTMRLRQSNC